MRRYFSIFFISIALYGCEDFLDTEPVEQISIDEQLSSKDGLLAAVSGIYKDLETLQSSNFHVYSGILSGNYTFAPSITTGEINTNSEARIANTYEFENTPDDLEYESFYDNSYELINQINLLLELKTSFNFLTEQELSQLEAELLAIRAFTHYNLSLLFAQNINFTPDGSHPGIIYNQQRIRPTIDFPARETVARTYELIQEDLDNALALFTDRQILSVGESSSYFNTLTTTAIYAKIALQFNDWEKAANYASTVINTSGIQLTSSNDYVNQWLTNGDLDETILSFAAPRDSDGGVSSSFAEFYTFISTNNYKSLVASGDLLNAYEANDLRLELYQEQELDAVVNGERVVLPFVFSRKFQPDNETLYLRLSEVLLIQAEALQRINPGDPIALTNLNQIRQRAGLTLLNNSANILEEIFQERRRELAFENNSFFDLLRYQKDVSRNLGCIAATCDITYPSPFLILPIPNNSVRNNENMVQNEGY